MTTNPQEYDPVLSAETWYIDDSKSIALIVLRGVNRLNVNHRSTTTYEVVSGGGKVTLGEEPLELNRGDTFVAPVDVPYQTEGDLMMLATSTPPFNIDSVEILK